MLRQCFKLWPRQSNTISRLSRNVSDLGASDTSKTYIPRRACLYMPGNDEKKLKKVESLDVDCVILDCEDGVAINRKEEARLTIKKMLDVLNFGRTEPIVRVNSCSSGMADEDLRVTLQANKLPPTLMLPKVEEPSELTWFAEKLEKTLNSRVSRAESTRTFKQNLIIFIESAIGLIRFEDICRHSRQLENQGAPFYLDGVVFGSDDFCANIGATRTTDAKELLYARQKIVVVAKAYGLQAIDLVHINFKDTDGLREQSLEGARMGFTGKQCIHPAQVPIVQEAFRPSNEKIEWATQLIEAFKQHQDSGKGAFTFRGSMIDMPLLLQAKNIVQLAQAIEGTKT